MSSIKPTKCSDEPARIGVGWVSIAGRSVPIAEVLASPASRARWLAAPYDRRNPVQCLCSSARVPLGIKFYESYGTYALYPLRRHDPGRHAPGCPFRYPPGSRADPRAVSPQACVVERAGSYWLDPDWPLYCAAPRDRRAERIRSAIAKPMRLRGEPSRAALLTLLELLWRLAGLHYWQPAFDGQRDYATVAARLAQAAARVRLRDRPLAEWLYVPPPFRSEAAGELARRREAWLARLRPAPDGGYGYGYVLGLWRSGERSPDGERVVLQLRHTPVRLVLPAKEWDRQAVRWGCPTGGADDAVLPIPSYPVVWLARVRLAGGLIETCDLAALSLTDGRSWLPCGSTFERQVLQRLVDERRMFVKPVEAGGLGVAPGEPVPDVVLLDRRDRHGLEILGRTDEPAFAARRSEKAARYRERRQLVWTWDPSREPEMPPLPPADRR